MAIAISTQTRVVPAGGTVRAGLLAVFNAKVEIWGQSNAVGRSDRVDIAAAPLSADPQLAVYDAGIFDRVWIWNGSAYIKLQPSVFNGQTTSAGDFGVEFGLAVRWMRETLGGNLYIHKNCEGGLSITEFSQPSGAWYASGLTESSQGDAWLAANGVTIGRKAFIWIQGEQDAAQTEAWYATRQSDLIAAVRANGVIAADSLVVLSRMHPSSTTYGAGVDAAKVAYAAANPSNAVALVMPNYLSDGIHLNARGMVQHAYDLYQAVFGGSLINV